MKSNRLAAFGLAAGLLGGGVAGLALGVPGGAFAQSDETTTSTAGAAEPGSAERSGPAKGRWARDALAKLVTDGTITRAQADAVAAALEAARPPRGAGGHKGRGFGRAHKGHGLDAAASALGMTVEELRSAVSGGKSLTEVAREKGVDPEKLVEAMVAERRTRLAEAVAAGRLTQARADEMLATMTERARAVVNGQGPAFGGRGHHGRGGDGRRGFRGGAPSGEGSSFAPSSSGGATST